MSYTRISRWETLGLSLVSIMALLQCGYALLAFLDPIMFATVRGTALFDVSDSDWIYIYASRTLFIALLIAYLAKNKQYPVLMWAAIFGTVMPVIDGLLAYQAGAANGVVYKHMATVVYLLFTSFVLRSIVRSQD